MDWLVVLWFFVYEVCFVMAYIRLGDICLYLLCKRYPKFLAYYLAVRVFYEYFYGDARFKPTFGANMFYLIMFSVLWIVPLVVAWLLVRQFWWL